MRVLLGLAALAGVVNAQNQVLTLSTSGASPVSATAPSGNGNTAAGTVYVYQSSVSVPNLVNFGAGSTVNSGSTAQAGSYSFTVANAISTVVFTVLTNQYVAQSQYRYTGVNSGVGAGTNGYICDTCCTGCSSTSGPASTAATGSYWTGYSCASFLRQYTYSTLAVGANLAASAQNQFSVELFDRAYYPDSVSYSFTIVRSSPPIIGDPQIYGLQGQDFQVHGIPDEIFNLVSYPNLQVNARFVYLSSAECHDNFTACFAHPGTYIGEEGIRVGNDKIHVKAGSFKKGLTVAVNGQRVATGKHSVKLGSVNVMSHRRVVVNTPVMTLTISNSDKFLNQETTLHDQKLLSLGAERRVLADGESFHPEVPLHGLQGQTWRNVEYPSGLEYEGSINDYHVVDGNLYGNDFVFNQFKL